MSLLAHTVRLLVHLHTSADAIVASPTAMAIMRCFPRQAEAMRAEVFTIVLNG
jgi:hypothetical protein